MADAEGHVLGNFHAYYSFNPVHERLRFMDARTTSALRSALLSGGQGGATGAATVIDIGCNEGDLTIGLYNALVGKRQLLQPADTVDADMDDVVRFDESSASVLNEKMQKEKRQVEYVFTDEGGSSHRKHFAVELMIDGELMGKGEGVSKKVAKAKAAGAALKAFAAADGREKAGAVADDNDDEASLVPSSSEIEMLKNRRPLFVLGVDIDEVLIKRAKSKSADLTDGDALRFLHVDVTSTEFNSQIGEFIEAAKRQPQAPRKFDMVTCFSVTMWIHLNHGDDGLWKFLETVSDMTEHLVIEPQPWKCYRNALKRLNRLGVAVPKSFRELKVRSDVVEKMDAFLLDASRFHFKADLGKTNWSRPVVLYSRRAIEGISYAER